jgi:hypothetical protein
MRGCNRYARGMEAHHGAEGHVLYPGVELGRGLAFTR